MARLELTPGSDAGRLHSMTSGKRQFDTLDEALRKQGIPFENYGIIHTIVGNIPMARYEETSGGIRAVRQGDGSDLIFKSGYTTGFDTREEAAAASEDGPVHPNSKTGVNWLVAHPRNSLNDGGWTMGGRDKPASLCPTCGNVVPATGICDFCD